MTRGYGPLPEIVVFRSGEQPRGGGPTAGHGRAVRDSKQQDGPLLTVSRDSWQAFLQQF